MHKEKLIVFKDSLVKSTVDFYHKCKSKFDFFWYHEDSKNFRRVLKELFNNVLEVAFKATVIMLILLLFGYTITILLFLSSIALVFAIYELPEWFKRFRQ